MILFRYLAKEVFLTLASLTMILLLIFMSNQFIRYLTRAASGEIPGIFIVKLMMLEMPNLLCLLLPLGLYVAFLVAYGRLYADSEMTVLRACGYGSQSLLKHSFLMAIFVAIFVGVLSFWAWPNIAIARAKLLRSTGIQMLIQTITPGQFRSVSSGKNIFYIEAVNSARDEAEGIFLARKGSKDGHLMWDIIWADKAKAYTNPDEGEDYVVLEKGRVYQGQPGDLQFKVLEFEKYQMRLPHPVIKITKDTRTASTLSLLPFLNQDLKKAAELQWRLAVPIMVLTLTLVAVPLSRIEPRAGKFAKLLPAIILFILYANGVFIARDWIASGKLPIWLGMWWLHGIVIGLGLFLLRRDRTAG